jgi:cytochrome c553
MKSTSLLLLALLALVSGSGLGLAADVAAGKALAAACDGCHGTDGVSQTPLTPSLAAQADEYLQWQLVFFRAGSRKSAVMQPIAEALKNEDIRNLGAYYATLKPPKPEGAANPDPLAERGAELAKRNRCNACHGDNYVGHRAAARLASQREDVLLKGLRDFKSGARVGAGIASMADVVYGLDDDDMKALAHFMATQP